MYFIMKGDEVMEGGIKTFEEAEKLAGKYLPNGWDGESLRPSQMVTINKQIVEYGTRVWK